MSASTDHAINATTYIAKHGHSTSMDIANHHDIPVEYLLKVLQLLVKAGVLRSKRGPRGGFELAKKPTQITLLDIVEAVDGPVGHDIYRLNKKAASFVDKVYDGYRGLLKKVKLSAMAK